MASLASISKSAVLNVFVLLLLTSQVQKKNPDVVRIYIDWKNTPGDILAVENANYPAHLNGLPLLSYYPESANVGSVQLTSIERTLFPPEAQKELANRFLEPPSLVNLRLLSERGVSRGIVDICPVHYDSGTMQFYKIEWIELQLNSETSAPSTAHLRNADTDGHSVLANGDWYKLPILERGVHKINYNYLVGAGINVASIDPRLLKLYGNGGGMLPQNNSDPRPEDLLENSIVVVGESDGRFDQQDYILFYAERAGLEVLQHDGTLMHEKNIYSDTSFYFLTISDQEGKRITTHQNLGIDQPRITYFDDYILYEEDEYNIINSGREWYGKKFDFTLTYDFKFDFPDLAPNTEVFVTTSVMGQTYEEASLDIAVNGLGIGQQRINAIVEGSYLAKGSNQVETFVANTSSIPESEQFTVRLSFNPVGSGRSNAYLNYLTVVAKRKLKFYSGQLHFSSLESTQNALSTFEIEAGADANRIWDISDPSNPHDQEFQIIDAAALFGTTTSGMKSFIAFDEQSILVPQKAMQLPNQDLHNSDNVDLVVITYPGFRSEAERLASFRESNDGLQVAVVTTNEVYNEFSSGKQDVIALRDYIRHVYSLGEEENRLQNVLLFGKCSFDYKNRTVKNTNFVPTYSSRNSLHPINSYSSDDYFGFLDEDEGEWVESYEGDHLMDVGVGRLPVKTIDEARIVVDKLIDYATNLKSYGAWRNELVFIADDGDGNLHQRDADRLATQVDTSYAQFNTNKIYVDAYEQVETSIGETAPGVNEEIERSMERGGLIFNFTGHGSPTRWTSETILNITSAIEFENEHRLPLFVTATCEFGRHDNPKLMSGAEYLLLNPKGGAIGLLTTSRPVFSSTNFILNRKFYGNVFRKENGRYLTIGEVFRKTKNQSLNGSVNRNFSLLADPSMTLGYPAHEIILTANEDEYKPGDTLSALSKVKFGGYVNDEQGSTNTEFNGRLVATIYDRPSRITTLGHEDAPMTFDVRDNILFRGEVSVKAGVFEIEFIVPKNVTFDFERGKVSMYALDASRKTDAGGSNIEFVIGGESDQFEPDNTPPKIELFINDTTFVERGIAGPDILLIARLSDESGISLSKSEEGADLAAVLDDKTEAIVNEYYVSDLDTYKRGWVTYPYKELSIGTHKIRLKAWDVHNNFNEAEIEFLVVDDENLAIEKLINFPNPVYDFTRFSFEHNRSGDDLEILIDVLSMDGKLVKRIRQVRERSESRISNIFWDRREQNGSKLSNGVYIFRLSIRSLTDGSKNEAKQKLVIIN